MVRRIAVVLMLASLPACGGVADPSKNKTETFPGVVPKGGSGPVHNFNSKTGELTITVTNLTPTLPSSTQFYLVWGQPISGGCSGFPTPVTVNFPVTQVTYASGTYCVQLADAGLFTADETYTVTVSHP
jgi:hypothetical protein